ncbi:MAG: sugar-binding domain-containing protein [Chloroflexota bacterium]
MSRPVDLAALVRVSRMYYELGETQESIAASLGVTRPQVSKLLKQARVQGVVEIRIVDRTERPSDVAAELQRRFGLRAVHVAPAFSGSDERTRRRVGRLAAQVLASAVRDGMVIGIGDGSSVAALADELDPRSTPVAATVVPLCGGFWGMTGGREPYRRIAEALGATAHGLLAPGLLDDAATRKALGAHAGIREVTDLWDRLDVAVFGIGAPTWSAALVGEDAWREIESGHAVGEILIAPFDADGRFVGSALRERTIACDARRLNLVPTSIGIASGPSKISPILGALRAGALNILVTDVETAERVLALAGPETGS